jgi:hypothetical protein
MGFGFESSRDKQSQEKTLQDENTKGKLSMLVPKVVLGTSWFLSHSFSTCFCLVDLSDKVWVRAAEARPKEQKSTRGEMQDCWMFQSETQWVCYPVKRSSGLAEKLT